MCGAVGVVGPSGGCSVEVCVLLLFGDVLVTVCVYVPVRGNDAVCWR